MWIGTDYLASILNRKFEYMHKASMVSLSTIRWLAPHMKRCLHTTAPVSARLILILVVKAATVLPYVLYLD